MKTRQFVKFVPRAMKLITFSRGVGTFLILGGRGRISLGAMVAWRLARKIFNFRASRSPETAISEYL